MNTSFGEAGALASLAGKVALVTGGTSGIGQGCAIALARAGAYVFVTGRSVDKERPTYGGTEGGAATVREIEMAGGKAIFSVLDVTIEADWQRVIGEIRKQFGHLDILINNAGRSVRGPMAKASLDDLWFEIKVNIEGAFMGTSYGWSLMKKAGGVIMNMNSTAGLHGSPNSAAYTSSKGALLGLTRAAAIDGRPFGIRVISLHPGITWTNGMATVSGDSEEVYNDKIKAAGSIPLGHPAKPADVAASVVFLASDAARHISGIEFMIDGGSGAR